MAALVGVSEDHVKGDGEDSANEEDLQHEVVQCLLEDLTESLGLEGSAVVVTEVCSAVGEVSRSEALFEVDIQERGESFAACKG